MNFNLIWSLPKLKILTQRPSNQKSNRRGKSIMKNLKIAIVGASGLVGLKIIEVLQEEDLLDVENLTLFVSQKSADEEAFVMNKRLKYLLLCEENIKEKFDIVFFSAGEDVSRKWAERFAKDGAFVIDNSNAFRREKQIPLVVPEINARLITPNTKIIANPNCSTIQLALAVNALQGFGKIQKIVVSTYQSVSGAGKNALNDLMFNTNSEIPEGICNNLIQQIGAIDQNGFCGEENKIMFELCKILNQNYSVCASTVRVPIPLCHAESVYVCFENPVDALQVKNSFVKNGLVFDESLSLPTKIANTNLTHVCRLRQFSESEIAFFVVADNLRRGAAYNAVLIAKTILQNKYIGVHEI